ncbi:hypothetical protein [Endozoicomonas sp. SESOKO1]|uniref:hypothetical protein n=1 Tax=Endozoicomonas sp. SESOKO1 TaxID=2828742 RepID=UPI002147AB48|nr:hypothetical protein [Endozoicomonas sp. SESOKO1]
MMNIKTLDSLKQHQPQEEKKPPPPVKHKKLGEVKDLEQDRTSPYFTKHGNQLVEVNDGSFHGSVNRIIRQFRVDQAEGRQTLKLKAPNKSDVT